MKDPHSLVYGFGTTQHWCPGLVPLPLHAAGARAGPETALSVLSLGRLMPVERGCAWAGPCLAVRDSQSGRSPEEPGFSSR